LFAYAIHELAETVTHFGALHNCYFPLFIDLNQSVGKLTGRRYFDDSAAQKPAWNLAATGRHAFGSLSEP
jgi:hypothetical protein